MDLNNVARHVKNLKERTDKLDEMMTIAKSEKDAEIQELDAQDIKQQVRLVERQLERLKRFIEH